MKASLFWRIVAITLAVGWFFAVVVNYYIVHKPFAVANALALLNVAGDIFVAGALFALAAALGRRITRAYAFASPLEALVLQTGLGLGLISFATFALGLAGLLQKVMLWGTVGGAALLLRDELLAMWRDLRAVRLPIASRTERAIVLFIGASFCLAFFTALTPTLAWDAQIHHLVVGKIALARGVIAAPPDNPHLSQPALEDMLYLAVMGLKDDGAVGLMHLGFALLTCSALFALSTRYLTPRVGWGAVAILVAVPSFLLTATWAYTDIALAFYAFVAFYAVMIARETGAARWFILAGVFAGFAAGEKYTALIVPAAVLVLIWRPQRMATRDTLLVGGSAALTASPWFVRNWIFTGNPIYPFLFGGQYWNVLRTQHFAPPSTFPVDLLSLLALPWNATIYGVQGTVSFDATIGPLLLMLLPLLVFVMPRGDSVVRNALAYAGLFYLFWLALILISSYGAQTRLVFFIFPVLAWLAAVTWERLSVLDHPRFSLTGFTRLVLLLILVFTLLTHALEFVAFNPAPYLVGMESRNEFLRARLLPQGYYQTMQFLQTLDGRILFLWEPRDYYAESAVRTQADSILDAFANLKYLYGDADGIANALRDQGFTYVLVNRWGLDFHLAEGKVSVDEARLLQEFLSRHGVQVYGALPLDLNEVEGQLRVQGADYESYAIYAIRP